MRGCIARSSRSRRVRRASCAGGLVARDRGVSRRLSDQSRAVAPEPAERILEVLQDAVERSRDKVEIEGLHEEDGVLLLTVPHEAVQLFIERPGTVRGLHLVRPEGAQLALLLEQALHSNRPHGPGQFVLEIACAGVEPNALELTAVIAPKRAQEVPLLASVIEPRQLDIVVLLEEKREVPEASHWHDADALRDEIATTATRERLDGATVARALDKNVSVHMQDSIRSPERRAATLPCYHIPERGDRVSQLECRSYPPSRIPEAA